MNFIPSAINSLYHKITAPLLKCISIIDISDILVAAGLIMPGVGLYLCFGLGWSLIIMGFINLALGVAGGIALNNKKQQHN